MSTLTYVFLGLFFISTAASYAVPVKIIRRILSCLVIPFLGTATILILWDLMPYSFHIIVRLSFYFGFLFFALIFEALEGKHSFYILSCLLKTLALIPVIDLFRTVFYLVHIPLYMLIIAGIIYFIIMIVMIIFMRNQIFFDYIFTLLHYLAAISINFIAFLLVRYESDKFSIFLFAGSVILILQIIFKAIDRKHFNLKVAPYICSGTFLLSQIFILLGCIFLLAR